MRYGNRIQFVNWRVDPDGFLRVTARVLKEGVFPYAISEFPEELQKTYHPDKKALDVFIPAIEFTPEALATLEGKPVIIIDHVFRDPENTLKDGYTVGNVCGAPYIDGDSIIADLLITDADTIQKIVNKELVEVSSGYDANFEVAQGAFNEIPFDGSQVGLHFNHVLLLPVGEGRCGYEVRIINRKTKEKETMIEVRIGNRVYRFENEKDAEEAKRMSEDAKTEGKEEGKKEGSGGFDLEAVKNAMEELPKLQEQTATHKETIANLEAEIAKLKDPEEIEKAATEMLETAQAIEDVTETEVDEKDRETVANSMKGCNSIAKIRALMAHVGNKRGVDVAGMSDGEVKTLFKFTAANSKKVLEAAKADAGKKTVVHFGNRDADGKKVVHPLFKDMK